ncbi:AAA family ATPase [Kibdelosporangium phytohabitans]|uniref:HTH luxR-type domain-containing protein n=1 Tax=Kibdelosporangium phytohabitans TaxID=860235 RepID=A0A0N7F440_9PSEU|nr:AAA family ATPase [Kibdelosporangium phytohabitans]ALG10367.1 hypothetical protein AOZ06_28835 [Kibdelosporangium phytohabitans]MBE1461416.1 DNA-binding CsgD family transcriptional regulator [Kibdelosporangium phytohabitans]
MARQKWEFVGRREEIDALRLHRHDRALVVLRGRRGSGRSALLARMCQELAGDGVVALDVSGAAERPAWDEFGVRAILGAIRERFEDLGDRARLTDGLDTLSRLCTEAAYSSPWGRFQLLNALAIVFTRVGRDGEVVVVVDDADRLPQPGPALAAVRRAGHVVLASCAVSARGEAAELCALADQVVELGPLSGEEVDSVLRHTAGAPVDDQLRHALREDLGPLYGNAGTLVSTVAELRRRSRLVTVHGHVCLRDPREPIPLSTGHPLLSEVGTCGALGRDLVLLAASDVGFGIDEIPVVASATGRSQLDCGRAVDHLVLAGVLTVDAAGRLTVSCRALGTAVSEHDDASELHRAIAAHLLGEAARPDVRPSVLDGHIVAAGRALSPRAELVDRLSQDERVVYAAHHTAHRYVAWWHAGESVERSQMAADLVLLLVHTADYARLAQFIGELAESSAERPEELAAAAVLAALHLGRPVSAAVRAAVTGHGYEPAALTFCDQWFAGATVQLNDIESAFAPLRHWFAVPTVEGHTPYKRNHRLATEHALAMRDLVPGFEAVLGSHYSTPVKGPLAVYHRVNAGYAGEDWAAALSAARELELDPCADEQARQSARLHAAEMCAWHGDDRRATGWLASVSEEDCAFPLLRAWVDVGLRFHAGDAAGALTAGWSACDRAQSQDAVGSYRLLRRMAEIAVDSGNLLQARRIRAEAVRRYTRQRTADTLETMLYVHGVVDTDSTQAQAAERMIRARNNRFELSLACQVVGMSSAQPRRWLREAFEIAQEIGADRLTTRVKRTMEDRGVMVSVPRGRRDQLTETESRIIELVRLGRTNRQIALAVRISEKTVEKHLTRLFARAGRRTRHGLATSGLGGRPESLGA